jgi:hypothetical protein
MIKDNKQQKTSCKILESRNEVKRGEMDSCCMNAIGALASLVLKMERCIRPGFPRQLDDKISRIL